MARKSVCHAFSACGGQTMASELELQMVVSFSVGVGNHTWLLEGQAVLLTPELSVQPWRVCSF